MILLDTNVLIYATDQGSEHHEASRRVVDAVIRGRLHGVLVPQILVEFIGATTGPSMRRPLTPAEAIAQATVFHRQIRVLQAPATALDELGDVVLTTGRAGRRVFDYYLAAQARALGISTLCTYNEDDFTGIPGLTVLRPTHIGIAS